MILNASLIAVLDALTFWANDPLFAQLRLLFLLPVFGMMFSTAGLLITRVQKHRRSK